MKDLKLPVYLDYMATTPVDQRVADKMCQYLTTDGVFGNPASVSHSYGWAASEAVELARQQVAKAIGCESKAIIWTSGATESNNLAIQGAARFYHRQGKHIITAKTEHKSVLDTCEYLGREGYEVTYLWPDQNGVVTPAALKEAMREDTILVSLMHVNNEVGVVQDIKALGEVVHQSGALFHVDAAQSIGKVAVDVMAMDVDLLSLSAHKAYGPKGVGALYVRQKPRVRLQPLMYGGGHEHGLRAGTLAPHQIVGMGEAFRIADKQLSDDVARIRCLRDKLWTGIQSLGEMTLNSDLDNGVANNLNVAFGYVDGEALLMGLRELAVSTGSACTSATIEPSHVLQAMQIPNNLAHSAIRFSLGRFTTEAEIDFAIERIQSEVKRLRALSPLWENRDE